MSREMSICATPTFTSALETLISAPQLLIGKIPTLIPNSDSLFVDPHTIVSGSKSIIDPYFSDTSAYRECSGWRRIALANVSLTGRHFPSYRNLPPTTIDHNPAEVRP